MQKPTKPTKTVVRNKGITKTVEGNEIAKVVTFSNGLCSISTTIWNKNYPHVDRRYFSRFYSYSFRVWPKRWFAYDSKKRMFKGHLGLMSLCWLRFMIGIAILALLKYIFWCIAFLFEMLKKVVEWIETKTFDAHMWFHDRATRHYLRKDK